MAVATVAWWLLFLRYTEGTDACNYGRSCGILRVDDRDVGDILMS